MTTTAPAAEETTLEPAVPRATDPPVAGPAQPAAPALDPGRRPISRRPMTTGRSITVAASAGVSLLALWALLYVLVISNLQQARSQHELYTQFRAQLALATAPIGGVIPAGKPVAVITSAAAGLRGEVVVEGTTAGILRLGPGHLRTTPLPGQPGLSVVYGRALAFGAPFARVSALPVGSPITVTTDQGVFHYAVTGIRHAGDPFAVPAAGTSRLTLVTSEGGWTPDRAVFVDAALVGKPATDPGGRASTLAAQEKALAVDDDPLTLVQLVLWLQALVVVACGTAWLSRRWSRRQVWIVAAPCLLVVLWGLSGTAVRLLPNLM